MRLVLFEEQTYTERAIRELLRNTLREADDGAVDAAWSVLSAFALPRSSLIKPGDDGRAEDEEEETFDMEGTDSASTREREAIALFNRTRRGDWKVGRLVGTGTLTDLDLQIEVLPKITHGHTDDDIAKARLALLRMWSVADGAASSEHEQDAAVGAVQGQLHEWLISRFLTQTETLLQRGVRLQYEEREDNLTVLRGRLLPAQNQRENRFAPHRFVCRYEELTPNRAENRLICSALDRVLRWTEVAESRRRALSLIERLFDIPRSHNIASDFAAWRSDRLMAHYRAIRPTCSWILNEHSPAPVRDEHPFFGCFVLMHQLFERYVASWIEIQLKAQPQNQLTLHRQETQRFCRLSGRHGPWQVMQPDLLLKQNGRVVSVIDTKWKRVEDTDKMARADLYQMATYATFFLQRKGQLSLVYPSVGAREPKRFAFAHPMNDIQLAMHWFHLPLCEDGSLQPTQEGLMLPQLFDQRIPQAL